MPLTRDEIQELVEIEATLQGVDPAMALAVAKLESGFDPTLRSPKDAFGVMQLRPKTAKMLGVNRDDVGDNIAGGVKYLAQLSQKYDGDRERTLAAYNAGPGMVDQYKGVPPFKETRGYVSKIMGMLSPASAEAAPGLSPAEAQELQEIEAELARRAQQAAPASPPTAASTPAQDAAYRAARTAEPPSDLTVDIEKASPPLPPGRRPSRPWWDTMSEGMEAGTPGRLPTEPTTEQWAAMTPDEDAAQRAQMAEQAKQGAAMGITGSLGAAGAVGGGVLGGVPGAYVGGALGAGAGTRLTNQLNLTEQETPLVETPVANLYPSDALNVGLPLAARALAPVATRVGNTLSGTLKPAYQRLVDLGEKWGIRLSVGDIKGTGIIPKAETYLESVPGVGAQSFRERGQAASRQAGETYTAAQREAMTKTPWRDLPAVQRAAEQNTSQGKAARALLEEIENAGDDWGRIIQASGKLNLFQDSLRAKQLYDRMDDLATPLGNMRLPQTMRTIDAAVKEVQDDLLPSAEVKREVGGLLARVREAVSPTPRSQPSMGVRDTATGTLRAEPMTQSSGIPDTTYGRMRRLRSDLGAMQRTATEPATARYLGQVKTALENDMRAFAEQSGVPALRSAQRQADQFYRQRIVPYREGPLAKASEKDLPDEIYGNFVRKGKDRATYFYKGLDAKGQAAVRYGMAKEAMEAATNHGGDLFSPAKFAQSLRRIQEASGVFFKGEAKWELDGFRTVMEHGKRFGQYGENPPTGARLISGGLAATAFFNPAFAVPGWGGAKGLQWLFMTRPGRSLLLAASDLQPGSSALTTRLNQALRSPALAPLVASGQAGMRAQGEVSSGDRRPGASGQ